MAFCILKQLAKSSIRISDKSFLWATFNFSTTSEVSSKINQIKSNGNIFEQARKYSEKSSIKRKEKGYGSASDSGSDSDKEKGKRKDAYTSSFWRQKMRTMHGIFDVNNDGVISYEDFMLLAQKFGDLGHLSQQQLEEFKNVLRITWVSNWGEVDQYNLITVEQYLADMHHTMTDKDLRKKVHNFLPFLFQAVDHDHSGEISITEFKLFFNCLGLTDKDAERSFVAIDKNSDGMLSIKEFVKIGRDFFHTEDTKKVSKNFWGPLVADH
ncbi:unnamed protein product [Diamesa tonsa]